MNGPNWGQLWLQICFRLVQTAPVLWRQTYFPWRWCSPSHTCYLFTVHVYCTCSKVVYSSISVGNYVCFNCHLFLWMWQWAALKGSQPWVLTSIPLSWLLWAIHSFVHSSSLTALLWSMSWWILEKTFYSNPHLIK